MRDGKISAELSKYFSRIGKKGGKLGAPITNAKLTTAKRRKAGKKAANALTPAERSARAKKAALARWKKERA